jgi:hypothetical protein
MTRAFRTYCGASVSKRKYSSVVLSERELGTNQARYVAAYYIAVIYAVGRRRNFSWLENRRGKSLPSEIEPGTN